MQTFFKISMFSDVFFPFPGMGKYRSCYVQDCDK